MIPLVALLASLALLPSSQNPAQPPLEVEVQVALLDVFGIDGSQQTADLDFVVMMAWTDPDLVGAGTEADLSEVWTPEIVPVGVRGRVLPAWSKVRLEAGGRLDEAIRYTGTFTVPMSLEDFPLDRHTLRLRFAAPGAPPEQLRFVAGPMSAAGPELTLQDWDLGPGSLVVEPLVIASVGAELASFSFDVPIQRRLGFALGSILLPILCILLMAWSVYWFPPGYFANKIGISTTAVLTLIAYRFVFASMVPKIPYLTRMDKFMLGATLLVFASFLKMVVEANLLGRKQEAAAERLDRRLRWAFPALLAAIVVWSFAL